MLGKTHHIAIICSDYHRSREFYVDKLGFTVLREVWREERQDWLAMLQQGEGVLELFARPTAPQRPTQPEALGLRHLAFQVENAVKAAAWLHSRGIETEPIRYDPINGGRMTFFHDPDGLPLELHEENNPNP